MAEFMVPDVIAQTLGAIRTQIDVITALSSGGFSIIIFTWARVVGVFNDADFSSFRKPQFFFRRYFSLSPSYRVT